MKLLYITEDKFPPYRADVVELFARKMPAFGHRIDWLMQRGPNCQEKGSRLKWLGNRVYLIPRASIKGLPERLINVLIGLIGEWWIIPLALTGRYDVIQVRDKFFTCIPAWIAARLTGARFCYWMSYPFPESRLYLAKHKLTNKRLSFLIKGYFSHLLLYGFIVKVADHIFVQSEQMLKDVSTKGVPCDKMTPVPMGIRAEQVGESKDACCPNREAPMLVYLGTLVRIRHLEFLIEVLVLIREKYPEAKLYMVGDGEMKNDRAFLEHEAERLGQADHVIFTGFLPVEDAWSYVRKADICLSPIYPVDILRVGSPTKLIEYLAMAKVAVASEHPEQCQVLEESGAGRCIAWDTQTFADEIIYLLDHPEEARDQAARGPDYIRSFRTYDVIAAQVDKTYRWLLS